MARIEIYARLRPTHRRFEGLITSPNDISVQIGRQREDGAVERFSKAPGTRRSFRFSRTFDEGSTQSEIFETVARKIVDRFAEGYNGTVFAYGQTSTGKTYTIEGDTKRDEERGLIPRTLSYLYALVEEKKVALLKQAISQIDDKNDSHLHEAPSRNRSASTRSERERPGVRVHVSYMEIYQDTGFDLLNAGARPGSLMLTLPKVQISETADGRVTVRDLSLHEAPTEQVALALLKKGSACRKVAETAMNQSSSRSHSIFTITMTTKQPGSEVILRSKLHLVDLAGSERVSKTGSGGRILQEAKYINLSLHHLEHVIVSLQQQSRTGDERRRGHIPYRNSMLTMALRDSLGGNCLTAMIATVSAEEENILETTSTLRFSQRVACVSNTARPNEELDDKAVIRKLKKRVSELERELTTIRETKTLPRQVSLVRDGGDMSEAQRQLCHHVLYDFFHGKIANPVEAGINTPALFQECLQVLRGIVIDAVKSRMSTTTNTTTSPVSVTASHHYKSNASSEESSRGEKDKRNSAGGSGEGKINHTQAEAIAEGSRSHRKRHKKIRSHGNHSEFQLQVNQQGSPHSEPHAKPRRSHGKDCQMEHQLRDNDQGSPHSRSQTRPLPRSCEKHRPLVQHQSHDNDQGSPPRLRREFLRTPPTATEFSPVDNTLSSSGGSALSPSANPFTRSHSPRLTPSTSLNKSGTPSPSSRQSSGIGSLQEYDPRHQQNTPPSSSIDKQQPAAWAKRVSQPYSVTPDEPKESSIINYLSKPVAVSPEARMMTRLQEGAQKLQRSREKKEQLSADVQLLSLRVQEEDLRTKLDRVGEQLASQHARILGCQQPSERPNTKMECDLGDERLVEHQLRIKQARLHQKLLGVQQQIRSLQMSPQIQKSRPLPISPSSTTSPVTSPPHKPSIAVMVNEVARNDVNNTKVRKEIDILRESQLEKELQLKEAATRRKMQELKKQLKNSTTTNSSSSPTSPRSPAVSDQDANPPETALSKGASKSRGLTSPCPRTVTSQSPRVNPCQSTRAPSQSPVNDGKQRSFLSTSDNGKTVGKKKFSLPGRFTVEKDSWFHNTPSTEDSLYSTRQISGPPQKTVRDKECAPTITPHPGNGILKREVEGRATVCRGSSSSCERGSVANEVARRRRERVLKIRRCVAAATTIQRAWRSHRSNMSHDAHMIIT